MKFDKFIVGLSVVFVLILFLLHYFALAQKIHGDACIKDDHEYRFYVVSLSHAGSGWNDFSNFQKSEDLKYGNQNNDGSCIPSGHQDTAKLYLW